MLLLRKKQESLVVFGHRPGYLLFFRASENSGLLVVVRSNTSIDADGPVRIQQSHNPLLNIHARRLLKTLRTNAIINKLAMLVRYRKDIVLTKDQTLIAGNAPVAAYWISCVAKWI